MLGRHDILPLATAAGSAAATGLALALWLSLPSYLSAPTLNTDPIPTSAIDPNLARYRQMAAAEGVDTAPVTLVLAAAPVAEPALSVRELSDDGAADSDAALQAADYRAGRDRDEMRRVAWLEEQREIWRGQAFGAAGADRRDEGEEDYSPAWERPSDDWDGGRFNPAETR